MKNGKKKFILIEALLAAMIIVLAAGGMWEKSAEESKRISVIIQDSDNSQWAAFKYGMEMAAADYGLELFVVSTAETVNAEEEEVLIDQELKNGADAVILQMPAEGDFQSAVKKTEKKVPVLFVAESPKEDDPAVIEPDYYGMGKSLAEELLKDFAGKIEGKTAGILASSQTEANKSCERGVQDALEDTGAAVLWSAAPEADEETEEVLTAQAETDFVIALDDESLTAAGRCSAANNLHGALVYGIGQSTEAVYYLDTGAAECLVVPDDFNMGYQSVAEIAEKMKSRFHTMQSSMISYTVMRRETLFTRENQDILFTMSQ